MSIKIGDTAPNFVIDSTIGFINFHKYLGDDWGILFTHPEDFTPICTAEISALAQLKPHFESRNIKVLAMSTDTLELHQHWIDDIKRIQKISITYPLIADNEFRIAHLYDFMHPNTSTNATLRSVVIVDPHKKIKLKMDYPPSIGRNFMEILRAIDAMQQSAEYRFASDFGKKNVSVLFNERIEDVPKIKNNKKENVYNTNKKLTANGIQFYWN